MAPKVFHQYWEIPDGTDCHRKAYATTSVASVAGLTAAAYRVTLNPPGTFLEGVAKVGQYTFTAAAVGAVFGLTSCISAQVREKPDDPLNYFLGGCAGGLTLGARSEWTAPHPHLPPRLAEGPLTSAHPPPSLFHPRQGAKQPS